MQISALLLLAVAWPLNIAAQPLGADPSIQVTWTTLKMGSQVVVNEFGSLPPWSIYVVDINGNIVQTITTDMMYLQWYWDVTPFPGIECCSAAYRLMIVDVITNVGYSNYFTYNGCNPGCGPASTLTTTVTSDIDRVQTSTDTQISTTTVTKYPKCCPVSVFTSTVLTTSTRYATITISDFLD